MDKSLIRNTRIGILNESKNINNFTFLYIVP